MKHPVRTASLLVAAASLLVPLLSIIMSAHNHPATSDHAAAHGHDHQHFAAANKAYFDEHADKLEEMHPHWRAMSRRQVEAMRTEWPDLFDKERTAVLDFACGIGTYLRNPTSQGKIWVEICSNRSGLGGALTVREEHRRSGHQSGLRRSLQRAGLPPRPHARPDEGRLCRAQGPARRARRRQV